MAKGHCIFHVTVRDPERYEAYIAADADVVIVEGVAE
jgi:uncharacterized protein (DUF1330 family)